MTATMVRGDERREAILAFCREFIAQHGYSPSVAEIAEGVGLQSKTAVRHHLSVLVQEGSISVAPGKYRSLVVND